MPNISVVNMQGQEVSKLDLSDSIFGITPNVSVMHMAVVQHLANRRQGTQSTLTRTEVRGGGRKPWRQKGTGHARQGSIRSPQWRHGGVALGPKPRSYSFSLNKKTKRLALKSALSSKVKGSNMVVIDNISIDTYRTKTMVAMMKALNVSKKALVVLPEVDKKVIKSFNNIQGIKTTLATTLNVYDILNHNFILASKDAISKIEEMYS